jgi:sodium-independent sulfate anion transporter 11
MGKINGKIAVKWNSFKNGVRTDENLTRVRHGVVWAVKALPSATGRYMIQKVPVVQWLPKYSPKWVFSDFIAGVTVGVLMIPQALAYAALAGLPLQVGLLASWIPSALYFFQGTSKGMDYSFCGG